MNILKEFLCIVAIALFFGGGCSPSEPTEEETGLNRCYLVKDAISEEPIEEAKVQLSDFPWMEPPVVLREFTNDLGRCCFEVEEGRHYGVSAVKDGYLVFGQNPDSNSTELFLIPAAFLQIHVKNVGPTNEEDLFQIGYPAAIPLGWISARFSGSQIDTTVTLAVQPQISGITWSSTHMGETISDTILGISISSRDTFKIELEY